MNIIIFMVICALGLSLAFVASYLWALSDGQYDDLETPAYRILRDEINDRTKKERK